MKPDFHLNQQLELEFGEGIKKAPINRRLILDPISIRRESHVSAKDAAAIVDFCNQSFPTTTPSEPSEEDPNKSNTNSTEHLEEGGGHQHAPMS